MPGLLPIIFLAVCTGISAYAARLFVIGMRSRSWPCVQGTITTSRVETALFPGSGSSTYGRVLVLNYTYDVAGQPYTGQRIAIAPSGWFSLGTPGQLHARYPKGVRVTVFYSPDQPSQATLVNGVPGHLWSFYLIAGMFALLGLMSVVPWA